MDLIILYHLEYEDSYLHFDYNILNFSANASLGLLQLFNVNIGMQDSAFLSEVAVHHLKKARGEIWPKRSERRNNTKTTKMRTKCPQ